MRKFLLAATAASALSAAVAVAQTAPGGANDTTAAPPAAGAASPTDMNPSAGAPKAPPFKDGDFVQLQSSSMLSSNVVGLDVYDDQHHNLGKIKDLAFDDSKKVTAYIVSVGGVLGMGARYIAVNPEAIAIAWDSNNKMWRAAMSATNDQLKTAPEFKYVGQWNGSRS